MFFPLAFFLPFVREEEYIKHCYDLAFCNKLHLSFEDQGHGEWRMLLAALRMKSSLFHGRARFGFGVS